MNLLPKASGARPRVACEIGTQGVVAGRSADAAGLLSAVAKADLREGAVTPGLKPGNIADRVQVIAAVRKVMEGVGLRGNARGTEMTLILPDAAVRVLLLEFESLPGKLSEALPLVRFRLKKLLPFEADDAMITFQIMSHGKSLVRVLAVAIPRDVLAEYETAVREAGFEPGAVLPSTLAALAGIGETEPAALLVNANRLGVTTAIVREGVLLLHRTMDTMNTMDVSDLRDHGPLHTSTLPGLPPARFEGADGHANGFNTLPLVSVDETYAEWAKQQPLPEHGHNPYADRARDEEAVGNEDGITALPLPPVYAAAGMSSNGAPRFQAHNVPGAVADSPFMAATLTADLASESHNAEFYAPTSIGTLTEDRSGRIAAALERHLQGAERSNGLRDDGALAGAGQSAAMPARHDDAHQQDLAEAVSVAAAYFEDTLSTAPQRVWSAGPLGAEALRRVLQGHGVGGDEGLQVRELVDPAALAPDAVSGSVPRGWLAGVRGALRS